MLGTAGRTTVFSASPPLSFSLRGAPGSVTIAYSGGSVLYRCVYAGADVAEENSVVGGSAGRQEAEAELGRLKVSVTGADMGVDEAGAPLVLFRLHTVRESDLRETTVHRRFRDFFLLDAALRAAYKGSSLLGSFPALPPRSLKLFADHTSPEFVNRRVFALGDYLHKMLHIPRARGNPDLLTFLGIIDGVRETSALFPGSALGLALRGLPAGGAGRAGGVEVTGLTRLPEGGPSPAAAAGVRPGDRVSKINGEDALSDGYDMVVARLKAARRPVLIHFLGELPPRPADGAPAAAAAAASSAPASAVPSPPKTSAAALGLL